MAIELAYINTQHPDFHKDAALVFTLLRSMEEDNRPVRQAERNAIQIAVNSSSDLIGDPPSRDISKVNWYCWIYICLLKGIKISKALHDVFRAWNSYYRMRHWFAARRNFWLVYEIDVNPAPLNLNYLHR